MPRVEYKIIARPEPPFKQTNVSFKSRLRSVQSTKGGSTQEKTLKDFLEIIDVMTLPLGFVEANCEWLLKEYYRTNKQSGWSPNTVFDFLVKLRRKPSFVLEFITKIQIEMGVMDRGFSHKPKSD